jgi:hypothetical protein
MSTANSYNFDYSSSNINVYKPDDRSYPQIWSTYTIDEAEEIIMSNKYTSTINALFTCVVDNSADVDLLMSKVVEDIKRMFDDQHTTLQTKGMIREEQSNVQEEYLLNKLRPGRVLLNWNIRYRVSMDNPSST